MYKQAGASGIPLFPDFMKNIQGFVLGIKFSLIQLCGLSSVEELVKARTIYSEILNFEHELLQSPLYVQCMLLC